MEYYRSLQALRAELGVEGEMRFVFESGPDPESPYFIDAQVVGDLYRVSDVMFMPSHREGFGMPVMEASLAGILLVSRKVPAAEELGSEEAILFDEHEAPPAVAARITAALDRSPIARLRQRVRGRYTWERIFENQIEPLLARGAGG
jgi:glycosyltransferase involved in cell wall biosynthesis